MPTCHPKLPPPPKPTKILFDPFNSSSTGHQTAPNLMSGSTSWRESRTYKLSHQFSDPSGHSGLRHLSDLVGAGSENYQKDGRKENGDWEKGAPGLREIGWQDIRDLMRGSRKRRSEDVEVNLPSKRSKVDVHGSKSTSRSASAITTQSSSSSTSQNKPDTALASTLPTISKSPSHDEVVQSQSLPPQIFRGLTIYLNGSTAPLVSDHRLKQLIATHGGNTSLALGRRTVTHVILGKTCGGGLAAGKMHKEITTIGGKGIKFVTAQWVLDSIDRGVRLSEGRYQPVSVAGKIGGCGQKSVAGLFLKN